MSDININIEKYDSIKKKEKKKITFSGFEIPYEFYIGVYITIMVITTLIIYFNKERLDNSYFRSNYKFYYFILMANLINMTYFTIYYHKKKNQLIGEAGIKGDIGSKGTRGKYITCSFCEHNLYFLKTKNYTKIVTLNVGLEDENLDEDLTNFSYSLGMNIEEIDLSFLKDIHKQSRNNKIIQILKKLFNYSTRMRYLSYNLNKNINQNNNSKTISFFKPIGGNGYFPIGHSVFNTELANKMNAFLVNGDIRFPQKYQKKFTFENIDVLERQGKELNKKIQMKYSFIKPIPPIDEAEEGDKREFVALGELIIRNQDDEDIDNNRNLMACIRKSCAKEIPNDMLELMAIKISYNTTKNNINKILSFKVDNINYDLDTDSIDIYSIWKTPMNTYFTNSIIGNYSLVNGTIGYNIVSGRTNLLDKNNYRLNNKSIEEVTNRLKSIELPRMLRIIYVMNQQYYIFFDKIIYIMENIIVDFEKEKQDLKKGIIKTNKQRARDEKKIMDIEEKILLFENMIQSIKSKDYLNDFDSLFDAQTQQTLEDNLPDYKRMRENLTNIPMLINKNRNLYDMLIYMFPLGFNTILDVETQIINPTKNKKSFYSDGTIINPIQIEILKICKVCFPPNEKVYIPKNECMSYNTVDLDRRTLYRELNSVITEFEKIELEYLNENNNDNDNSEKRCGDDNWLYIYNEFDKLNTELTAELGHIKDFYNKIKTRDMDKFSNSRIQLIINYFREKIKIVENNCVIKE